MAKERIPLLDKKPSALSDWDYEKNADLLPTAFSFGSNQKVWWKCRRGHSYQLPIHRYQENKCPICSRESQTSFPEQAIYFYLSQYVPTENRAKIENFELDIYIPSLQIGIEYDGVFFHRSEKAQDREERKNAVCIKRGIRLLRIKEAGQEKREGDIIYYVPQRDYSSLTRVICEIFRLLPISNCQPVPNIDVFRDQNHILDTYISLLKERSISKIAPTLIIEWNIERNKCAPDYISAGSKRKFWWKCENGHEWQAAVYSRVNGNNCPYCAGQLLIEGENDLLSKNPALCKEWDYQKNGTLQPNQISANNARKVWWICSACSHSWQASIAHRNNGKGCPICGNKHRGQTGITTKINKQGSLGENSPQLAAEWDYENNYPLTPFDVTCRSGKSVWWRCEKCHFSWTALISNRSKGAGCPNCSHKRNGEQTKQRALQKTGSILLTHPHIAAEWDYEKNDNDRPENFTYGSSQKVWWLCERGHSYCSYISNRCRKGQGCPVCYRESKKKKHETTTAE